jgi:histone H3/H4
MDENAIDQQLTVHNIKAIGHEFNDRITDDAATRVAMEEEKRIQKIFRLATVMARHAGRKTVREEDIQKVLMFEDEL